MGLADYNGWVGADRERAERRLQAAIKIGRYPELVKMRTAPCSVCGASVDLLIGRYRVMMLHAEEYGPTMDDHAAAHFTACPLCHGMIHLRFRFPGRWEEFKQGIRAGKVPRMVEHIGVVFGWARGWKDLPVSPTVSNDGPWWDRLSCERYSGPRKTLK